MARRASRVRRSVRLRRHRSVVGNRVLRKDDWQLYRRSRRSRHRFMLGGSVSGRCCRVLSLDGRNYVLRSVVLSCPVLCPVRLTWMGTHGRERGRHHGRGRKRWRCRGVVRPLHRRGRLYREGGQLRIGRKSSVLSTNPLHRG